MFHRSQINRQTLVAREWSRKCNSRPYTSMLLVPRKNAQIDNVKLATSVAFHLTIATNKWLMRLTESLKAWIRRSVVFLIFTCWWLVGVGSYAAYRMIFSKRYTFDVYVVWHLVWNYLHMLQLGIHQTLGYTTRSQSRERWLLQSTAWR